MARRGRSNSERQRNLQRDTVDIANPRLLQEYIYDPFPTRLTEIEDRRRFNPEPDYPARDVFSGKPSRFAVSVGPYTVHSRSVIARSYYTGMPRGFQTPIGIKFSNPLSVTACVRRKVRKAIMFAKGHRKKGSGARRRERNQWSNVWCK